MGFEGSLLIVSVATVINLGGKYHRVQEVGDWGAIMAAIDHLEPWARGGTDGGVNTNPETKFPPPTDGERWRALKRTAEFGLRKFWPVP